MKAYKYDSDFYYIGEQECQADPIASKREGHNVWLLPANCTWEKPLEEKEGYKIKWNGEAWGYEEIPVPPEPEPPTLDEDEVKAQKIAELKGIRDTKEVEPIQTDKGLFDYDDKARDRIKDAMVALKYRGTIEWTLADNTDVSVSQLDLENVILAVASRSNDLHIKYRELKQRVNAAQTVEEVETITWDD